jgi:hypothetical protein
MATLDVKRDWETIRAHLPADYRELAFAHKALRPHYGNARIATADELLRLILLHVGADLPLRQTVALVAESGGPDVSPYCLHMHMRTAGGYLAALVGRLTSWRAQCEADLWDGYELVAVDGSSFAGRCATGTDARLHAALRLSDLRVVSAHALGVESGETFRRFHWLPGQLAIADRGYSNAAGIAWVVDHGADVLVRLNRGALPLVDRRGEVDVPAWARTIAVGCVAERAVRIEQNVDGRARIIEGRLIATRLPDDKAEEARARIRAEQGRTASKESLEMAAYVILFTTTSLPAERCIEAYRLRWQIELLFKRWKSLCGFDRLPNERADTVVTWLTAKLLLGLLVDRMASAAETLSPPERSASRRKSEAVADGERAMEDHHHPMARDRRRAHAATPA